MPTLNVSNFFVFVILLIPSLLFYYSPKWCFSSLWNLYATSPHVIVVVLLVFHWSLYIRLYRKSLCSSLHSSWRIKRNKKERKVKGLICMFCFFLSITSRKGDNTVNHTWSLFFFLSKTSKQFLLSLFLSLTFLLFSTTFS